MTDKEAMKLAQEWQSKDWNTESPMSAECAMSEANDVIEALKEALAKQEQGEPVGVAHLMQEGFTHCIWSEAFVPTGAYLYTTPQQRKPLTDEQVWKIVEGSSAGYLEVRAIEAAIEAAHGIKE